MLSPHRANTITITIILQAIVQKTAEHMDFCKVKRSLFYVEQLYDEKGTRNTLLIMVGLDIARTYTLVENV